MSTEGKKNTQSTQLQIPSFIQSNNVTNLVDRLPSNLKGDERCLLMLFMFLPKQLIGVWLPTIVKYRKIKMCFSTAVSE